MPNIYIEIKSRIMTDYNFDIPTTGSTPIRFKMYAINDGNHVSPYYRTISGDSSLMSITVENDDIVMSGNPYTAYVDRSEEIFIGMNGICSGNGFTVYIRQYGKQHAICGFNFISSGKTIDDNTTIYIPYTGGKNVYTLSGSCNSYYADGSGTTNVSTALTDNVLTVTFDENYEADEKKYTLTGGFDASKCDCIYGNTKATINFIQMADTRACTGSLSISPYGISIGYKASSTALFSVTSSYGTDPQHFTVSSNASWLSLSVSESDGGTNIPITATTISENTGDTRTATITIKQTNAHCSETKTITATQETGAVIFTVNGNSDNFILDSATDAAGKTYDMTVVSQIGTQQIAWSSNTVANCTVDVPNSKLIVPENKNTANTVSYIAIIKQDDSLYPSFVKSITINGVQKAATIESSVCNSVFSASTTSVANIPISGATGNIEITSQEIGYINGISDNSHKVILNENKVYTIATGDTWVTASRDTSNGSFNYTVAPNTSETERSQSTILLQTGTCDTPKTIAISFLQKSSTCVLTGPDSYTLKYGGPGSVGTFNITSLYNDVAASASTTNSNKNLIFLPSSVTGGTNCAVEVVASQYLPNSSEKAILTFNNHTCSLSVEVTRPKPIIFTLEIAGIDCATFYYMSGSQPNIYNEKITSSTSGVTFAINDDSTDVWFMISKQSQFAVSLICPDGVTISSATVKVEEGNMMSLQSGTKNTVVANYSYDCTSAVDTGSTSEKSKDNADVTFSFGTGYVINVSFGNTLVDICKTK